MHRAKVATPLSARGSRMETADIREEAKRLVEKLPSNSTWDDLMHEIYVRQAIESGLSESELGKVTPVADVRKRFGLPQ